MNDPDYLYLQFHFVKDFEVTSMPFSEREQHIDQFLSLKKIRNLNPMN